MSKHIISVGMNRKLGKKIGAFNLPAGITCPGATTNCARVCYAKKAERMYKSAANKRGENLIAARSPNFVERLSDEIRDRKITMLRWFESGDVEDQAMLDKVLAVCRQNPQVTFLMYSKSFHLDWSCVPSNLMLYWSIDSSTNATVPSGRTARTVLKGEPIPTDEVTCAPGSKYNYCGVSCRVCWEANRNVYFKEH